MCPKTIVWLVTKKNCLILNMSSSFYIIVILSFPIPINSFVLIVDFGPHCRYEQDWYFRTSFIIIHTMASAAIPNLFLPLAYSWKHMVVSISTVKLLWWSVLVELCICNRVTDHCSACFWQIWIPVRRIGTIWATYLPVSFLFSLFRSPSHGWKYTF